MHKNMKITISEKANPNYLAKVVRLEGLKKHLNADKLQTIVIDFQTVITGMDSKDGDICVFFPLECQINLDFLSQTNSFRENELNKDKEVAGFFEKKGRVRAVKLRGEKSMGYLVTIKTIEKFTGMDLSDYVGQEFDMIGDILMLKKYEVPVRQQSQNKQGKKPRISRLIEGQYHLHIDTENLRKNAMAINPEDEIMISYKLHGSSFIVGNVLGKKKLSIFDKILKKIGLNIVDTEYDLFYGSRKVVKNCYETQHVNDFYEGDLWGDVRNEIGDKIPKGFTVYGEVCGFTKTGQAIQKDYDYGCKQGEKKIFVYRITVTNVDGYVINLSTDQTKEFCNKYGLVQVPVFYQGKAKDLCPSLDIANHWHEEFIKNLEKVFNEKDCYICVNKVPEEGIVLRKEGMFEFKAFKLKSWKFLEYETEALDKGEVGMEDLA